MHYIGRYGVNIRKNWFNFLEFGIHTGRVCDIPMKVCKPSVEEAREK
jgi:hypothetical protein